MTYCTAFSTPAKPNFPVTARPMVVIPETPQYERIYALALRGVAIAENRAAGLLPPKGLREKRSTPEDVKQRQLEGRRLAAKKQNADRRRRIVWALRGDKFQSTPEVAAKVRMHPSTVQLEIRDMLDEGLLETSKRTRPGGGNPQVIYKLAEAAQ